MMRVFYGAAIQGSKNRKERFHIHEFFIETIKKQGFEVSTEHTTGRTYDEAIKKLEHAIGPLPKDEFQRKIFVRNKMIEAIEGDIRAAVFEVSTPSLGTGIEIAHAYLRPRLGLPVIPVLALYEKDYWPNKLSTMIKGISKENVPHFTLKEYENLDDIKIILTGFLNNLK
jgi:uncharacterized protein YhaN